MSRLLLLMACFGTALGCSVSRKGEHGGGNRAMSPELMAFLTAEDLDDVGDARNKIKELTADDRADVHSILAQWQDAQAVSNLLLHPDLIPEDVRLASLFRGLAEKRVAYYNLAAVVGFQEIKSENLSNEERDRVVSEMVAIMRKTTDARAARASLSIENFFTEKDAPQVLALVDHGEDTVRKNLRALLFNKFKHRDIEAFTAVVGQSGLEPEAKGRIIAEFKASQAKPTNLGALFAYIPNLREFNPSAD